MGRHLPANVGQRAARPSAWVVATIEHSNAPRIVSATVPFIRGHNTLATRSQNAVLVG